MNVSEDCAGKNF